MQQKSAHDKEALLCGFLDDLLKRESLRAVLGDWRMESGCAPFYLCSCSGRKTSGPLCGHAVVLLAVRQVLRRDAPHKGVVWGALRGETAATQRKKRVKEREKGDELGLQSVRSEQIERRTLDIVRAGLQLSFRMSRQMLPLLLMLQ